MTSYSSSVSSGTGSPPESTQMGWFTQRFLGGRTGSRLSSGPLGEDLSRGDFLRTLAGAIALATLVFVAVASLWILLDVRNAQTNHEATLTHLSQIAHSNQAVLTHLKNDEKELASGNKTVSQILKEAGQAVAQLERDQAAICSAVHADCTSP